MATSAPARKSLIDIIRERSELGPVSELELVRFEKQARDLCGRNPAMGYAALGILACLRGDEAGMREWHGKALVASGSEALQHHNFAVSLAVCGLIAEAIVQVETAHVKEPAALHYLGFLVKLLHADGQIERAHGLLAVWDRLSPEPHLLAAEIAEDLGDLQAAKAAAEDYRTHGGVDADDLFSELGL